MKLDPRETGGRADPIEITFDGLILRFPNGEIVRLDPFDVKVALPFERPRELLQTDSLVGVKEKARLLGVDAATIYRHAKDLGGRKVGGVWRFPREDDRSRSDGDPRRAEPGSKSRRRTAAKDRVRTLKVRGEKAG
ncbi:MAG: helix-turn-helix domain-containing protein [Actinobacteria bacterium]|nr:helix-turn-helix domain-containing protein [Actinomycetota bacterium]